MKKDILVFKAQDKWLVMDLYRFLHALNVLYNRFYVFNNYYDIGFTQLKRGLAHSLYWVEHGDELLVNKIRMESPAEFNLKGIGEIIEQLRHAIKDYRYRDIEREMMVIELLRKRIALLRDMGYSDEEIKQIAGFFMPSLNVIQKQIEKNNIEMVENEQNEDSE